MANSHSNLTSLFTDIASAIRTKTGTTGKIVADAFPEAIRGISSGSEDELLEKVLKRSFTEVTHGAESIGPCAFAGCLSLTSVNFPVCTSIGNHAFWSCSNLTSISFPNCTFIGSYAFSGCSSLTSVVIPDSVTSIGCGAFEECSSLTEITLPFVGATKDGTENTHLGYLFGASKYYNNGNYTDKDIDAIRKYIFEISPIETYISGKRSISEKMKR